MRKESMRRDRIPASEVKAALRQAEDGAELLAAQLRLRGLPEPLREYCPGLKDSTGKVRKWRFDLAWLDVYVTYGREWTELTYLIVEVHGATHAQGRHTRGTGFANDREKMNAAQLAGWTVLEYPIERVKDQSAADELERLLC